MLTIRSEIHRLRFHRCSNYILASNKLCNPRHVLPSWKYLHKLTPFNVINPSQASLWLLLLIVPNLKLTFRTNLLEVRLLMLLMLILKGIRLNNKLLSDQELVRIISNNTTKLPDSKIITMTSGDPSTRSKRKININRIGLNVLKFRINSLIKQQPPQKKIMPKTSFRPTQKCRIDSKIHLIVSL
jgi:hypothetical protein